MSKKDRLDMLFQKLLLSVVTLALIALPACSNASSATLLHHRIELNFNLDWKYYPGDASGAEATNYSDVKWIYVDLPHSTKFVTPEDPNAYLGISWYRKHFTVDKAYQARKIYIQFGAAMQSADVWVNGTKLIRHVGGYTPFTIDVTDAVKYDGADNLIAVKLDSNANQDWAPGWNGVDFQYDGGLYRDVKMVVTDLLHVTDAVYANKVAGGGVFVTYPSVGAASAKVVIKTNVINESAAVKNVTLVSTIVNADGKAVGTASSAASIEIGKDHDFTQEITVANPKLWNPYTPNLYTLRTIVEDGLTAVDDYSTRIGIRRIEWSHDGGLIINGARFKALGVNMHQEIYGLGNAVPDRAIYYDVKRIKAAGLNFIRGSHYPHSQAFYDACDELGILVLDSQTGWQQYNNTAAFNDNTFQELRDMIRSDRNHPSVVAWEASLNESNFPDSWAVMANRIVHQEYPGDQAFSAAWKGSYADIFIDASQHNVRASADPRPIIIDEYGDWDYGGASSTSRQAREAGDVAMLSQADNVQDGENKNVALGWFTADGYWDYADYGGFSNYGITRSGLVDMYRIPKFAYYFLQSQRDPTVTISGVDSGPMVYIANQWTSTSPTTVRVYSNCDQVALSLNNALVATQSPDTGTNLLHPPFDFDLGSFTPGTLRADCLIGGAKKITFTRQTPGAAMSIRLRPEATTLLADGSDARLVFIDIVDANGTVVPTDSSVVTLSVKGPGSIAGPVSLTMKGGQLATWVRANRTAGTLVINASAPGLTPANLKLISKPVPGLPPLPADRGGG
jgi:hypothetical protein